MPQNMFRVDPCPLHFVHSPNNNQANPVRFRTGLANGVEHALHGLKSGLSVEQERSLVNYAQFNFITTTLPPHRNVIDRAPTVGAGEQLTWKVKRDGGEVSELIRPEQKSRQCLKEVICRFTQKGDSVLDMFGGAFSTAMACMELPEHRKFIGCENDGPCHYHAYHHCLCVFARTIAESTTDIEISQGVVNAANVVHTFFSPYLRPSRMWTAPIGFPMYQALPRYIVEFLSSSWTSPELRNIALGKSVDKWKDEYKGLLNNVDSNVLRSIEALNCRLYLAKSTIRHPASGTGVFSAGRFAKGEVVCYYYGTLVYHSLEKRPEVYTTYGTGILGVTPERFPMYAMELELDGHEFIRFVRNNENKKTPVIWIVPAPFCVGG